MGCKGSKPQKQGAISSPKDKRVASNQKETRFDSPKRQASLRRGDSIKSQDSKISSPNKSKVVPPSPNAIKRHGSPHRPSVKKPAKANKSVLAKHKIEDLPSFAKAGNTQMVHSLCEEYGVKPGFITMGLEEDVNLGKILGVRNMRNWNLLLIAAAFERLELFRYLLTSGGMPLNLYGSPSGDVRLFVLQIAVEKRNQELLKEVWQRHIFWQF